MTMNNTIVKILLKAAAKLMSIRRVFQNTRSRGIRNSHSLEISPRRKISFGIIPRLDSVLYQFKPSDPDCNAH